MARPMHRCRTMNTTRMLLVGCLTIGVIGCVSSDDGATRSREFDGMIATTTLLESGDIDVSLSDAAGAIVASLSWRADEESATWQADGIAGGEFAASLTLDSADELLYSMWLAADRAQQSSSDGDVAYKACYGWEDTGTFTTCCDTEAGGCVTTACCGWWGCDVWNDCWG